MRYDKDTPKEWFESLHDFQEIIQTEAIYDDAFFGVAFIRYRYSKRKKKYIKDFIRLHRKKICLCIAKNPGIIKYDGKKLEEYEKEREEAVYNTFNYQTRSASFRLVKSNGRCINCSLLLSETKRNSYRYCSEECKDEFYTKFDFSYSKQKIWYRDQGICQMCKKSTRYIKETIHKLWWVDEQTKEVECDIVRIVCIEDERSIKFKRTKSNIGRTYYLPYYIDIKEYDDYEVDHIIEISTGKTPKERAKLFLDYDNLQILCVPCHKEKTAKFLSKRFKKELPAPLIKFRRKTIKDFFK